jgi:hypothetical protein
MLRRIENKLAVSKRKVSKKWESYRKEKHHIKHLKRLAPDQKRMRIESARDLTKQKISDTWLTYREEKYSIVHKSPFRDFLYVKKISGSMYKPKGYEEPKYFHFHKTYQKLYKAKRGYKTSKLDKIVPDIIKQKDVKGVLVMFKLRNEDTDTEFIVANFINKGVMETVSNVEAYVLEYLKLHITGFDDYVFIKDVYIRIVYEKA